MSTNEDLLRYLQEGNFDSFMQLWKKQYVRLGHLGGQISLAINDENRSDINGFLGKDYEHHCDTKISWSFVKKEISKSRFEGADFEVVLRNYFGEDIITSNTQKERKNKKIQNMIFDIEQTFQHTRAMEWLQYVILEKGSMFSRMKQEIYLHSSSFKKQIEWVMDGINQLPFWHKKTENIAIFASKITQDPHAFDSGSLSHYFLMHALCFYLHVEYRQMNQIEKNELLFQVGLYRDSVSNFVMLAHINAFEHYDYHHTAWNGFYEHYEAWNVNTQNLTFIESIDGSSCELILITENPSVFQELIVLAKTNKLNTLGFLCTNGQLNFCGYLLMDMIHQSGINMMYSGDMDPEGLLIADKLKLRYNEHLQLWRYSRKDYEKAMSKKYADKKRLAMIELIQHEELKSIGSYLQKEAIGYQENLIEEYKMDLYEFAK